MLTKRDIKRVNRYIYKKGLALFIVDLDGFKTALETAPRGLLKDLRADGRYYNTLGINRGAGLLGLAALIDNLTR